ncbi:hypothetical protein MYU51_005871 [Penicillium brevicompactum]
MAVGTRSKAREIRQNSKLFLPPELWNQICQSLSIEEVCALRLSCIAWSLGTYDYFADQLFHDFYLTLTSDGLRALEYVAGHKVFSAHVKRLWVIPTLFCGEYTWTPDDIHRHVEMLWARERHQRQLASLRSLPGSSSRDRILPKKSVYHGRASLSKLANERRHLVYKNAVLDHFQVLLSFPDTPSAGKPRFRDALERCLPFFSNLQTVGLRHCAGHPSDETTKRYPMIVRGIRGLQGKLGFNPVLPDARQNPAPCHTHLISPGGTLLLSFVLSMLLAALGMTQTRVVALENSEWIMVDDGLLLTRLEEEAVAPIFQQLQKISVRVLSAHTEHIERWILRQEEEATCLLQGSVVWGEKKNRTETENNRLLPLLARAAPNIKSLFLDMCANRLSLHRFLRAQSGLDLLDAHFEWISENFKFCRLTQLSLQSIITTAPSFKRFLQTATHTLKHLVLNSLILTSEYKPSHPGESELEYEGRRVWKEIFIYLRDHSRIQYFKISQPGYQNGRLLLRDPLHDGPRPLPNYWDMRCYDISHDKFSWGQWINQLEVMIID